MKLVVTGVTRTGNLGGTAMLCAIEDVVGGSVDDLVLASILPKRDQAQVGPDHARIASADYRLWLLLIAPLCVLLWPIRRIPLVRRLMAFLPIMREFADADVVGDVSGIGFVDGRGIPLLYYNAAIALPPLFFGVPVHKLSQALGPFETTVNRMAARFILSRCESVAARGHRSLELLHKLGIQKARFRPDTSFAMQVPESVLRQAREQCDKKFGGTGDRRPLVIFTPSAVVRRYCDAKGISLPSVLAHALLALEDGGVRSAFLSHASDTGISKNDDMSVVRAIQDELGPAASRFPVLDSMADPRLARALIAQGDVFVASRFHSMIGALSQAVPVVTIGWGHKYREAASSFGMEPFVIDFADLQGGRLLEHIGTLLENRQTYNRMMVPVAERFSEEAAKGIRIVLEQD